MNDRRLVALLLMIIAGLLVVLVVRGCEDDRKKSHRKQTRTKTVTVERGAAPEDLRGLDPKAAKKAGAPAGLPEEAPDAGDIPAGAGQIPPGAIPQGAIPSGLPPGVTIPEGTGAFDYPRNIRVKVRPSRKLDPDNYAFCKINRDICNEADDFRKSLRNLPGL